MMDGLPMPEAEPGTARVFAGRYQVERMIARGGMGEVYLCTDLELRRPVALKILRAGVDTDDGGRFLERFRLEARTLATLNHANIVTLYDYGETGDGQMFLALEYIEGPRFTDIARQGPMDPARVVRLTLQVCRALRFAHRSGVVHRDLKPSNLLIRVDEDGEEQVKVVDFGLVKVVEDDQSLTRAGLILGSPHCMAPEQIRGLKAVDHRADIYAVGVLMFRALVGRWPFHGDTSTATMIAHINRPIPRFRDVSPDVVVPAGLEEVVLRCLEKDPSRRYPDVRSLMEALRQLSGQPATVTYSSASLSVDSAESSIITDKSAAVEASLPTAESTATPAARPPSSQLVWVGMGVGLSVVMLVMVVGVWLFTRASGMEGAAEAQVANQDEGEVLLTVDALEPANEAPVVLPMEEAPAQAGASTDDASSDAPREPTTGSASVPVEPAPSARAPARSPAPARSTARAASPRAPAKPSPEPSPEPLEPGPEPETAPAPAAEPAAAPTERGATYDADDIF